MIRVLRNLETGGWRPPNSRANFSSGEIMKTLKHFCVALTLALTLAGSTVAGEVPGWGIAPPAPHSAEAEGETLGSASASPATEIILAVVEGTLSIL
jgi:hypothetical protein